MLVLPTSDTSKQVRADRFTSWKRYFDDNSPEPSGDLPAGWLLIVIREYIGPAIYNKAVAEAQERMQLRVSDLTGELYVDAFQYWPRTDQKRRDRR